MARSPNPVSGPGPVKSSSSSQHIRGIHRRGTMEYMSLYVYIHMEITYADLDDTCQSFLYISGTSETTRNPQEQTFQFSK